MVLQVLVEWRQGYFQLHAIFVQAEHSEGWVPVLLKQLVDSAVPCWMPALEH